jgi:hypothetical protein
MPSVVNDGTLVRGSIDLTINSVVYTLLDYKRSAKARTEMDYDSSGKPKAASHAEDFETISGTIRSRSDKAAPPKFVVFSYDSKNWYIKDSEEAGSTQGLKSYAVEIMECISGSVTIT